MKVSRTVWRRGKGGDNIKTLPIPIVQNGNYAHDEKFLHHAEKEFAVHSRNPSEKQSDNSRSKAGNFHCREQD